MMVQAVFYNSVNCSRVDSQNKLVHLFNIFCPVGNLPQHSGHNNMTCNGRIPSKGN